MKEELKALKGSTEQIVKARKNLLKQKSFFNMKVEEKKEETGIEEIVDFGDSYESAKFICIECPIYDKVTEIREEHPKYGNRRIKNLIINEILNDEELNADRYAPSKEVLEIIIDNYFLYEGYKQETEIAELEKEARIVTDAIIGESKEAAKKVGDSFVNIVKPYGEVAKSQLSDAGEAAKKAVNKGSQKLKVFFEKIEEKTKTK